ncbi:sodium:calcium antiporter [Lysobacter sp. TY2-98]|uniref:sodium:calcium antiporter n=1 Tax=Lysobacter sp. TY2-98 TaxID=2290922 RepID=UPI000E1FD42E|nr:sodium:calcium antiporter [Lysobacter sp. TY2-98]AXK70852.1 sodium:calcium antiporter [Lysobacter sp. TY2-98]
MPSVSYSALWFLFALVLLAVGGDSVVRGAAGLARRLGWPPFAVGLAIVALATSIPELVVNFYAVAQGQGDLALGNAVGSNVVNVGLTLAVAAMVAPLLVRWRALAHLLVVVLAATALVLLMSLDGRLSMLDGAILLVAFVVVFVLKILRSRENSPEVHAQIESVTAGVGSIAVDLLRLVIAAVALFFGAKLLVGHAPALGQVMGLTPLVTGLLPVAIGTALPEVAGAVRAARRGNGDLVAGHVIGSSLVNILLVLGGMALLSHGLSIPASFVRYELPAAFVFVAMLLPILRGDMRVSRGEGAVLGVALLGWIVFELLMLHR